jgi:hypothetical protein
MKSPNNLILSGTAIAVAFSCAACASSPGLAEPQLASAATSVEFAEENGAREFGPAALERAQTELEMARTAAAEKEYETALRLAERAELDAELAAAQTNHEKAVIALLEIQQSIQTLRREIARNQTS